MQTKYVQVDPKSFEIEKLRAAASVLAEGGLLAFPTETVYGIAARADRPEALERLKNLKGRRDDKPFTIHIADSDDLFQHVRKIPPMAMRLVNKHWPGPMTLVLRNPNDGFTGLRWPHHTIAQDLIRLCNFPVAASSANPSEQEDGCDINSVKNYFDGRIEMALDGGPSRLGQSSSVIQVDGRRWKILREGPVTESMVRDLDYTSILFVCTGNTCRSPMAEGLCKAALAQALNVSVAKLPDAGFIVQSAGTSAYYGTKASKNSILALKDRRIDISSHRPEPITLSKIDTADYIFTMTETHKLTLLQWNPFAADRIRLLREDGQDISDPVGGDLEQYQTCANEIETAVHGIVPIILRETRER